jgi:hypothetical protein
MQVGDLVKTEVLVSDQTIGIVIETRVDMWGEEVEPSGVRIMWDNGDLEVIYEDEVEVISGR